ncbi:MAG: tetratricopeptide repeat protein, partial [Cyanobium sp.]
MSQRHSIRALMASALLLQPWLPMLAPVQAGQIGPEMPRLIAQASPAGSPLVPDQVLQWRQQIQKLYVQARYAEVIPLQIQELAWAERGLGPEHPDTATSLNNLAALYNSQGAYAKAEPLYLRALAIREKAQGPDHPDTATSLNNLAGLYESQGAYAKAEPLLLRAL